MPRLIMRRLFGCDKCLGYTTWHRNFGSTARPRWVCEGCHEEKVVEDPEQEKVPCPVSASDEVDGRSKDDASPETRS